MRAALHRAAKTGNLDRGRDLDDGRRRAHRAPPRSGAHASRWCVDELPERAPRPPRLRTERRARHNSFSSGIRVGPSELYGYDAHGNIAFLTDGTGAETDTYDYDAWGNLIASTGSTANTRLFVGEELDPDLGLINLRARQYKPATGRFLTIDPLDLVPSGGRPPGSSLADVISGVDNPVVREVVELWLPDRPPPGERALTPVALHRFLYANGEPINFSDPEGLSAIEYSLNIASVTERIEEAKVEIQMGRNARCWLNFLVDFIKCMGPIPTKGPAPVASAARCLLVADEGFALCVAGRLN